MSRLLVLVCCLASIAHAEVCPRLEFAEMEAMDRAELLALRCQYNHDLLTLPYGVSRAVSAQGERCAIEVERMDRIVARKYALKETGDQRVHAIGALCRKPPK